MKEARCMVGVRQNFKRPFPFWHRNRLNDLVFHHIFISPFARHIAGYLLVAASWLCGHVFLQRDETFLPADSQCEKRQIVPCELQATFGSKLQKISRLRQERYRHWCCCCPRASFPVRQAGSELETGGARHDHAPHTGASLQHAEPAQI